MRRLLILLALVLLPVAAEAGRPPPEYTPQDPEVQEALRQANGKGKGLGTFAENEPEEPPRPIPWLFLGFAVLLLGGALPFAIRAYRSTSTELRDAEAARNAPPRPRRRPTGPPRPPLTR